MPPKENRSKLLFLGLLGTFIEYYDYALYAFCAPLLSKYFFVEMDNLSALYSTYILLAVAALGRPTGSLIFGWLGDYLGRSYVLKKSMIGIAIPTTIIALTPNHEMWGYWSALIILVCRFMQGIFIAGEGDGVRIYVYESKLSNYPYIANALVGASMLSGACLASQAALFSISHEDSWMWRLPFILGGLFGLIIFWMRKQFIEFSKPKREQTKQSIPLNWRGILATTSILGSLGGLYHLLFVYRPTFISKISATHTILITQSTTTKALLAYIFFTIIAAVFAEKWSGRKVMILGLIGFVITNLSFFYNHPMIHINSILPIFPLIFFLALMSSPAFLVLMKQFNPEVRFRCTSIAHSFGTLLLSNSAPATASYLWQNYETPYIIYIHFFVLTGLIALGLIFYKKGNELTC